MKRSTALKKIRAIAEDTKHDTVEHTKILDELWAIHEECDNICKFEVYFFFVKYLLKGA